MKKTSVKTFIQNLYSLWVYDYHAWDTSLLGKLDYLEKKIEAHEKWNRILPLLDTYKGELADSKELAFLKTQETPQFVIYPYPQKKSLEGINIQYDEKLKMLYIYHKHSKLYYPKEYSAEACEEAYRFLIEQDQILEGGYLEKAPHCYQTKTFKIESGDVLIDGGAAEGLFALDNIDKVSHVYLIEVDKKWIPALEATFAPYKNKVTIISKYLSDIDDDLHVSLSSILSKHAGSCFVKMDIEGAEPSVIEGAQKTLRLRNNIKLSCCTYHYQYDAEKLVSLFDRIGYQHEFSEGYFFFAEYDMPETPFLRKALIRARK